MVSRAFVMRWTFWFIWRQYFLTTPLASMSAPSMARYYQVRLTSHGILQARILEWVAYPFSSGYSQARNRTGVSCIAYRFFTIWAIRKVALTSWVIKQVSVHTWVEPDISLRQNQLYFSPIRVWSWWKRKEPRMELLFGPEKPKAVTTTGGWWWWWQEHLEEQSRGRKSWLWTLLIQASLRLHNEDGS